MGLLKSLYFSILILLSGSACQDIMAQAGMLDSSFGNDGIVFFDSGLYEQGDAMLVQPDGKIVVLADMAVDDENEFPSHEYTILRFHPDGEIDSSFGVNGKAQTTIKNLWHINGGALKLQPDGKILAAGAHPYKLGTFLIRLHPNGDFDESFGEDGVVFHPFQESTSTGISSVALNADGQIFIGGRTDVNKRDNFLVISYTSEGHPNTNFGNNGVWTLDLDDGNNSVEEILIQPDGKLVLAGYGAANTNLHTALIRLNHDGTLDDSFGQDGMVITNVSNGNDQANAAILLPNNKIIAFGYANNYGLSLIRYLSTGQPDSTFGLNGIVTTSWTDQIEIGHSILSQPDGKLIATGFTGLGNDDLFIIRYTSEGVVDSSFGVDGVTMIDFGGMDDRGNDIVLNPEGKILVTGYTRFEKYNDDIFLIQLLNDISLGRLDFATTTKVYQYPNPVQDDFVLTYELTNEERLTLSLIDGSGRVLKHYFKNETRSGGSHREELVLDQKLVSGFYFLRLSSMTGALTIKLIKQE